MLAKTELERDLWYGTSGPQDAEIVIVGEAWGQDEAAAEAPFVGMSGRELTRILAEAGIDRKSCLFLNTIAARPFNNQMWRFFHEKKAGNPPLRGLHPTPFVVAEVDRLYSAIAAHPRKLIIAAGNYALWALTEATLTYETSPKETEGRLIPGGIMDYRGSMLYALDEAKTPLLPIIHPAAILRQWSHRAITVHDLKARVPMALRGDWRPNPAPIFWAPPTYEQAVSRLNLWLRQAEEGPLRLACDIETSKRLITCVGFADSPQFAMCIPLVKKTAIGLDSYWSEKEEVTLLRLIGKVLSHPNVLIEGQNFIYDIQYFQHWMGVTPKLDFDTMLAQHLLWPGTRKGLDYISSLYCRYHWFWKEDAKEWDTKGTLEDLLAYNCLDCVRTFEAAGVLRKVISQLGLDRQWEETMRRGQLALRMMNRGVRIDQQRRGRLAFELHETLQKIYASLERIIPQEWVEPYINKSKARWYTSPAQQKIVFGDILGMRLPKNRKTGSDTLGADGLKSLRSRYPEFSKIFSLLEDARSVAVFQSHFVQAALDPDGRMRCTFDPTGTETFRWASRKNAFDRGTNLQNIPKGDED